MMKHILAASFSLCTAVTAWGQAATISVGTPLNILDNQKKVFVQTERGAIEISRVMTPCAKNGGVLQPLVPVIGVHPVGEIEILQALSDRESMVVDMRETSDRVKGTIPGSVGIPYTEVANRLGSWGAKRRERLGVVKKPRKSMRSATVRCVHKVR